MPAAVTLGVLLTTAAAVWITPAVLLRAVPITPAAALLRAALITPEAVRLPAAITPLALSAAMVPFGNN